MPLWTVDSKCFGNVQTVTLLSRISGISAAQTTIFAVSAFSDELLGNARLSLLAMSAVYKNFFQASCTFRVVLSLTLVHINLKL